LVRHHSAAGVLVYNIEVEGDHTYFVGNASGGEWVHNNCIADAIANGHAFAKHVLLKGEFKNVGVSTVQQFADHIADVMENGTVRSLSNGRTAYWGDSSGTVVIHDPGSADLGTAFQPTNGISYFNGLH
jgi:filamentous hemagglutinin